MCVNVEMKYCKPGMYSTPSGLKAFIFGRSTGFTGGYSHFAPSEQFGNWNLSRRTTGKIVRRLEILRSAQDDSQSFEGRREKKAAAPPSFPSLFHATDCHPERSEGFRQEIVHLNNI
jgi:hypothetical protein